MIQKWEKLIPEGGSSQVDVWPDLLRSLLMLYQGQQLAVATQSSRRYFTEGTNHSLALKMLQLVYIPGLR